MATIDPPRSQSTRESEVTRLRSESFMHRLRHRWHAARTLLCVGLDGQLDQMPEPFTGAREAAKAHAPSADQRIYDALFDFHKAIVDATADLVCCYKPNIAFFEEHGPTGLRALVALIAWIQQTYPEIPVLLDAKRGDIGSTSEAYARAIFDVYGADAVTAQPYLGRDAIAPLLDRAERGVFVLCRTSNPGSGELQERTGPDGEPLYMHVARQVAESWNTNGNCGLVVGATYPQELGAVREAVGDMPILVPGIGAQGGDLEAVLSHGLDSKHTGLLISVSRNVLYASSGRDYASAARRETARLRNEIERLRRGPESSGTHKAPPAGK
ncbi:MAG TPA: orotidine-5'-phosphate decarboxylase [Ktedonobacterales bacterium]